MFAAQFDLPGGFDAGLKQQLRAGVEQYTGDDQRKGNRCH
jgi:hypothetical protein